MADTYRVFVSPRPLIPGARITLRGEASDLRPGSRVVVVMRSSSVGPQDRLHRVGTVSLVWGIDRDEGGPDHVQLRGEILVAIDAVRREGDDTIADVTGVESGRTDGANELISEAQGALRRYLGAAAEAGEGGDVTVVLPDDPVVASHQVASLVRISAPELQEVLESGDASARLERAVAVLRRETGLLRRTMGGRGA